MFLLVCACVGVGVHACGRLCVSVCVRVCKNFLVDFYRKIW